MMGSSADQLRRGCEVLGAGCLSRFPATRGDHHGRKRALGRGAGGVAGFRSRAWQWMPCASSVEAAHGTWGFGTLTLYAFSTENWNRPKEEVECLDGLAR